MLSTLTVNSGRAEWIGYQVLLGVGLGLSMQQPMMAVQTVLSRKDASSGMSLIIFGQSLGGAIFASVGQNVLDNKLIKNLQLLNLPVTPGQVVNAGATNIRKLVPAQDLPVLLLAYNDAITRGALYVGLGLASVSILGAVGMQWKSVKARTRATGEGQMEAAQIEKRKESMEV